MRTTFLLAFIALAGFLGGCGDSGPPKYRVSGTVNFQDKPLDAGSIDFIPDGITGESFGSAITAGAYEFTGDNRLPPGKYRVSIRAGVAGPPPNPSADNKSSLPKIVIIPEMYNAASKLAAEVTASGKNDFSFDLK